MIRTWLSRCNCVKTLISLSQPNIITKQLTNTAAACRRELLSTQHQYYLSTPPKSMELLLFQRKPAAWMISVLFEHYQTRCLSCEKIFFFIHIHNQKLKTQNISVLMTVHTSKLAKQISHPTHNALFLAELLCSSKKPQKSWGRFTYRQ